MNNRAPSAAAIGLFAVILVNTVPASTLSLQRSRAVVVAVDEAVMLMLENRPQEALETLDRAIEADDEYWQAHYQRGRALGRLGRWQESRESLMRALELNPGHGHAHRLASLAAAEVDDWDTAWDQAIKAQLAGEDMRDTLLGMYVKSTPPEDFAIRINAAPVFVADIESSTAVADIELPTNFNPNAAAGTGQRQGRAAQLEDSALNQSSLDLIRLQRAMRYALGQSPGFAVTLDPGGAKYVLAISITDISTGEPRSASGYFRLLDIANREVIYRSPIDFDDISSTPDIAGKLRRYVTNLTAWLAER